jgi:hypothetical protein
MWMGIKFNHGKVYNRSANLVGMYKYIQGIKRANAQNNPLHQTYF